MTSTANSPSVWWMHHGDEAHTSHVPETRIGRDTVSRLAIFHGLRLDRPVLSTPAGVDGCVYIGLASCSIAYDRAPRRLYCPTLKISIDFAPITRYAPFLLAVPRAVETLP